MRGGNRTEVALSRSRASRERSALKLLTFGRSFSAGTGAPTLGEALSRVLARAPQATGAALSPDFDSGPLDVVVQGVRVPLGTPLDILSACCCGPDGYVHCVVRCSAGGGAPVFEQHQADPLKTPVAADSPSSTAPMQQAQAREASEQRASESTDTPASVAAFPGDERRNAADTGNSTAPSAVPASRGGDEGGEASPAVEAPLARQAGGSSSGETAGADSAAEGVPEARGDDEGTPPGAESAVGAAGASGGNGDGGESASSMTASTLVPSAESAAANSAGGGGGGGGGGTGGGGNNKKKSGKHKR